MKRKAFFITVAILLLTVAHSFSQEEGGSLSISLKAAQDYAVEHNKALKNSSLELQKAEAAKWGAIATMLPQVSASLGYSNYCGYEMNFSGMAIAMPATGTLGITASIAVSGQQIIAVQLAEMSKTQPNFLNVASKTLKACRKRHKTPLMLVLPSRPMPTS